MSDFKAPPVSLGQIVLWRHDPTSPPSPAVVSFVGDRNLCLHIFSKHSATPLLRDGVFHVSDPHALREGNKDAGVWEHAATFKPVDLTTLEKGGKR